MKLRHLTAADYRLMPWKNGRGKTAELAVFPDGAGLTGERFVWRASIAAIEDSCEFSPFPGYDRLITVVAGAGMRLDLGSDGSHEIKYGDAALAFSGDRPTSCRLLAGAIEDFNLIVDRERAAGRLEVTKRARIHEQRPITSDFVLVHCVVGELEVSFADERRRLNSRETAIVDARDVKGLTMEITNAGDASPFMLYAEVTLTKAANNA